MTIQEQNTRLIRDIATATEKALQEAWLKGYSQACEDVMKDPDLGASPRRTAEGDIVFLDDSE